MPNKHWDETVVKVERGTYKGWLDYEFVEREYVRPQVTGDPEINYVISFLNQHLPNAPVPRALSLGSGGGNLERALIRLNVAEVIDGYEANHASVQLAKQLAEEEGMSNRIHYEVQDINRMVLIPAHYDFVIAKMALHHFVELERVYDQVRRALKPDGLFVFNEFIGPSRYQWTPRQLELMTELLHIFPEPLRWSPGQEPINEIRRPTMGYMVALDPSESVRSAEIMLLLDHYFEIVEYKPYGGALLHTVLTLVLPNFDLANAEHQSYARRAFEFEQNAMRAGEIQSDFAYVVARPRPDVSPLQRPIQNRLKITLENAYGRLWHRITLTRLQVERWLGRK